MATHRIPILGPTTLPESGVFLDTVGNQITAAAAPSVGSQLCFVLADGGTDEGLYGCFEVPQNYVGSPAIVVKAILDVAPSAGDDLGWGFRKRAVADNEAADGAYDAEQTVQNTDIGSTGSNYASEDLVVQTISLTAGDYAAGDTVFFYFYLDASGTSYTSNLLLVDLLFQYTDV